jgi:anti-sigma B factor antagonist
MRVDDQVLGPDLVLTTKTDGQRAVVAVKGELDAFSAPGLEDRIGKLLDDQVTSVALNMSETSFLDSSGLRAILTSHRRLVDAGGSLTLRSPSEPLTRLLEITGLAGQIPTESA